MRLTTSTMDLKQRGLPSAAFARMVELRYRAMRTTCPNCVLHPATPSESIHGDASDFTGIDPKTRHTFADAMRVGEHQMLMLTLESFKATEADLAFQLSMISPAAEPGSGTATSATADASKAMWHESSDGEVGVWIYAQPLKCEAHETPTGPTLVFSVPALALVNHKQLKREDLTYCMELTAMNPPKVVRCADFHALTLEFDSVRNAYNGQYDFVMVDGSERKGDFDAAFCPPKQP